MSNSVPEGWSETNINNTCDVLDSKRIPLNSQERAARQGDYPYYGANGIQGFINDYIFEGEYVLLAEDGGNFDQWEDRPISYFVSGKFWVNNHAHILKAKGDNITKFIHYSLVHKNILKHINGGTRAKLNQSDMRDIELLRPPLPEQKKIAAILTSVDTVIEKTQAQIDKLKDLKTGMMQELLTKGIGHTEFKDSPVGRIPVEWEVVTLADLISSMDGGVSVNSENKQKASGEMGILKTSCVSKGNFYPNENKVVLHNEMDRLKTPVKDDHIIFSRMNTPALVGESGYVNKSYDDLFLPDRLWLIDVYRDKVYVLWLSYILAFNSTRKKITDAATGTSGSMKNISKPSLLSIKIAYPQINEQEKIASILKSVDKKLNKTLHKLSSYQNTKKALMQDLLTGKVRVKL